MKTIYLKLALSFGLITSIIGCSSKDINNPENDENFGQPKMIQEKREDITFETYGSSENLTNAEGMFIPDRIFFEFDSFQIANSQKAVLNAQIELIKKNIFEIKKVLLSGYADARGSTDYNYALGMKRAAAVQKYFKQNGLSDLSVEVISYGKDRPLVSGHSEEAYKENRASITTVCDGMNGC